MAYEVIDVRTEAEKVGIITLNRPKQLNALNDQLMDELGQALKAFDADDKIGCVIITGSERAFAAGADIGAMAKYSFVERERGIAAATDADEQRHDGQSGQRGNQHAASRETRRRLCLCASKCRGEMQVEEF